MNAIGATMNHRNSAVMISTMFIMTFLLVMMISSSITHAQEEARIIKIYGGDAYSVKSIRLEPETLTVGKGAVVIWNNWARTTEVKIIFEDGKTCKDVTTAPAGFMMDALECYVTSWVPLGGTSSLRFTEAGTYTYIVETNGGIKTSGRIIIQ